MIGFFLGFPSHLPVKCFLGMDSGNVFGLSMCLISGSYALFCTNPLGFDSGRSNSRCSLVMARGYRGTAMSDGRIFGYMVLCWGSD